MPVKSQVERHPKVAEIERDIALRTGPNREIAERYGISYDAVWRHEEKLKKHNPARLRELISEEQSNALRAEVMQHKNQVLDVAAAFNALANRVTKILDKAEEAEQPGLELAAAESLRRVLKDIATLQGKMAQTFNVNIAITEQKEWLELRELLAVVFDRHEEAKQTFMELAAKRGLSIAKGRHLK